MRNPVLVGAAVAAAAVLVLAGGGIAYAQEEPVLQVDASSACGRVTLDAKVNRTFGENDTYEIAVFSGPNAGTVASAAEGQFFVSANAPVSKTFTLAEDAHAGDGFVSWTTVSGPNPEFYVRGAVAVDTDCAATPPVTVPPTTEPPVEEPPAEEPPAWTGATSFGDGLYQVGRDIPAGLFRTPGGNGCYYARLSSNDGSFDSIIANDYFNGPSSVTIAATDAFVSLSGGCVWTLDGHTPSNPTPAPAPPVAEEDEDNDSDGAGFSQVGELPTGIDTGRA